MRLSVGPAPGARARAVLMGLLAGLMGAAAAAMGSYFVFTSYPRDYFPLSLFQLETPAYPDEMTSMLDQSGFEDTGADGTDLVFAVMGLVFVLFGALWTLSYLTLIVRAFRTAAWLEGTRAYVRGAFRTRSIDLATAYVSQGAVTTRIGYRTITTPTLEARDQSTGARLSIPLASPGSGRLPPNELRALAAAMAQGRSDSADDRDVLALAERLRSVTP